MTGDTSYVMSHQGGVPFSLSLECPVTIVRTMQESGSEAGLSAAIGLQKRTWVAKGMKLIVLETDL